LRSEEERGFTGHAGGYVPEQRILLLGEGNLSFGASLCRIFDAGCATGGGAGGGAGEADGEQDGEQGEAGKEGDASDVGNMSDDIISQQRSEGGEGGEERCGVVSMGTENTKISSARSTLCKNLVASVFEGEDEAFSLHRELDQNKNKIKQHGGEVLFGVDATNLQASFKPHKQKKPAIPRPGAIVKKTKSVAQQQRFDRIVFNFPEVTKHDKKQSQKSMINANQYLLRGFFASAVPLLAPNGEIHVSVLRCLPYSKWGVVELARNSTGGFLELRASNEFEPRRFPGYSFRRGLRRNRKSDTANYQTTEKLFKTKLAITYRFVTTAAFRESSRLNASIDLHNAKRRSVSGTLKRYGDQRAFGGGSMREVEQREGGLRQRRGDDGMNLDAESSSFNYLNFPIPAKSHVRVFGLTKKKSNQKLSAHVVKYDPYTNCYIVKVANNGQEIYVPRHQIRQMLKKVQIKTNNKAASNSAVYGRMVLYNDTTNQYKLNLINGAGKTTWVGANDIILPEKTHVAVVNLINATDLNGGTGRIMSWSKKENRYVVQFKKPPKPKFIKLRPENVIA